MDLLLRFDLWLALIGGLLLIRQLSVVLAAEQGRRHDLVKKLYRANQDYYLSVLVPFLHAEQLHDLRELLLAVDAQEYPAAKVSVQIAATPETAILLKQGPLKPNVKVWTTPEGVLGYEKAVPWLIERCLAAGGSGLYVFLKPDDIIKPDYFQNVVARGADSFAIQGYVASKNIPDTPIAKVMALSTRLVNRIGNAGRYHMGLSCRLQESGWAIKQEVLEMIPYRRGRDLDNLEYTLRLNLENFRINWAPNVVVYSNGQVNYLAHLTECVATFFHRLGLLFAYGPRLLLKAFFRLDMNYLEQMFAIVKPPHFLIGAALIVLALVSADGRTYLPGETLTWGILAVATMSVQAVSLAVARCKPADIITMFLWTPLVYTLGLVTLPVALGSYLLSEWRRRTPANPGSYRTQKATRFNEEMEAAPNILQQKHNQGIHDILAEHAPDLMLMDEPKPLPSRKQGGIKLWGGGPKAAAAASEPTPSSAASSVPDEEPAAPRVRLPREQVKSVPLSNGSKQVDCLLKTRTTYDDEGREHYQLTLEYKALSFSTQRYRILDQAFYELQSKLMARGFTMITCGSCGNFYNPSADLPGALKNAGVCLFGKQGKEVNLSTDAVTVVSQACPYHCSIQLREKIVSDWKDSLAPREKVRSAKF